VIKETSAHIRREDEKFVSKYTRTSILCELPSDDYTDQKTISI